VDVAAGTEGTATGVVVAEIPYIICPVVSALLVIWAVVVWFG